MSNNAGNPHPTDLGADLGFRIVREADGLRLVSPDGRKSVLAHDSGLANALIHKIFQPGFVTDAGHDLADLAITPWDAASVVVVRGLGPNDTKH